MGKKLYALCVGINEYKYVPPLNGCVPDATNIHNYLEATCENTDYEFDAIVLTNEQATKKNVVDTFISHLGQAEVDDIAVFYFSGHGAEEDADEVFHAASNKPTLNTMVCVDSRSPEGVTDLADKEMRYLINKMTYSEDSNKKMPHFVVIMDSCHSGGGTKDADANPEMVARLTEKGSPRDWNQFIFSDKLSRDDFANAKSLREILPQGEHVHFSSCEGVQLAYEVKGSGVFTSTLLEVLKRTSGKVSYKDLYNRIRFYINGRFPQTPTISIVDGDKNAMNNYFLGGASENKGVRVNVLFNMKERMWLMDKGGLHGVPPINPDEPVTLNVLDQDGNSVGKAKVTAVMPNKSKLSIEEGDLDLKEAYLAEVKGMYRNPVNVNIQGDDTLKALATENESELKDKNVVITDDFTTASYIVSVIDGKYIIHRPADKRPLVLEEPTTKDGAKKVLDYLKVIATYENTYSLNNPKTRLRGSSGGPAVAIELYKAHDEYDDSQDEKLEIGENGRVEITPDDLLRIRVVNNTRNKKLYCSLLAMDGLFGVSGEMLEGRVDYIDAGEDLWVWEKDIVPFNEAIENYHIDHKWKEVHWNLKLLVATVRFEITELEQDALPAPGSDPEAPRGIKRRSRPDAEDWCTELVTVVIKNPHA